MSDSSPLRSITVMRQPKSATPIVPRMLTNSRVGGVRPFLISHLTIPPMLRHVLLRTAGFGARFDHPGGRNYAELGEQSFALRRLRRREMPGRVSSHRFHWPVSATMPSTRSVERFSAYSGDASDSFDLDSDFGSFGSSVAPDSFEFLVGFVPAEVRFGTSEAEPSPMAPQSSTGQIANPGSRLQQSGDRIVPAFSARAETGVLRRQLTYERASAAFEAGSWPIASEGIRQHRTLDQIAPAFMLLQRSLAGRQSSPAGDFWGKGAVAASGRRDFWTVNEPESLSRPSPFVAALQRSGEAANRPDSRAAASIAPTFSSERFGIDHLPLYRAPSQNNRETERSVVERVLQRTSWQPFAPSHDFDTGGVSSSLVSTPAVQHQIEAQTPALPFVLGSSEMSFGGARAHPPLPVDPVASRLDQRQFPTDSPLPLSVASGALPESSPVPRLQRGTSITGLPSTAKKKQHYGHPTGNSGEIAASDVFPTVLRRALAGPGSHAWSETGPVSSIWGELGQLVGTQTLPASAQAAAVIPMQMRTATQDRSERTRPEEGGRSTTSPGVRRSAGSTWMPPTSVGQLFPPVFRSAIVDRAEPDAERQSAAHEIMNTSIGAPLPPLIRRSMEQRLGGDLGAVRVHSGPAISRATDMLAARAMTRGSDVFMPSGVHDHTGAESMPLLAHELAHAATHLGHAEPAPVQRSPLVLAQRSSQEESRAEEIERTVSTEMQSRFPGMQAGIGTAMTLARQVANTSSPPMPLNVARSEATAPIQRDETGGTAIASTPQAVPDAAPAAPAADAGEIAEKVYALLERRLVVERERGGYRRP